MCSLVHIKCYPCHSHDIIHNVLFLWVANAAAARLAMEVRGDHVAVAQMYGRTLRIRTRQVFTD